MSQSLAAPVIDRAVIPAAGLGTRLRPLTHAIPKEMLPLGRKPVLEYVVEEMRAAGITHLLFVISPGKEIIRRYFGDGAAWGMRCDYAIQPEMRGLGDALLQAEAWSEGRPFLVAFGDCILESRQSKDRKGEGARGRGGEAGVAGRKSQVASEDTQNPALSHDSTLPPPASRLLAVHGRERADATVLTERIPREKTRQYGILAPAVPLPETPTEPFPLAGIVEKPAPEAAPGTMAVAARWTLNAGIFDYLRRATPGDGGEINLTDPVRAWLADGAAGWAVPLLPGEARRDIGGWETYLIAAARAAVSDPECGARVRASLQAEPEQA